MKHYVVEAQEGTEGKKQPVTQRGRVRHFLSPKIALGMARLVKRELGPTFTVRVLSKDHPGEQEVIEL